MDRARFISADNLGAERGDAPRAASEVRTLRILEILAEHTDQHHFLTTTDIKQLLANPERRDVSPIETSRSSIRSSIQALRGSGYEISSSRRAGYALTKRTALSADAALLYRVVQASDLLTVQQRRHLARLMLRYVGPTARRELAGHGTKRSRDDHAAAHACIAFRICSHEGVIELAIREGRCVRFMLADVGNHGFASEAPGRDGAFPLSCRQSFAPKRIVESGGTRFVEGTLRMPAETGPAYLSRTFRVDRMRMLTLRLPDGTLLVASKAGGAEPDESASTCSPREKSAKARRTFMDIAR